jgi:hypothetical protein
MTVFRGGVRRIASIGALTVGMIAAGGVGIADASPAVQGPRFTVSTDRLVLSYNGTRYEGGMRVTVRNVGTERAAGGDLRIEVPPGLRFTGVTDGGGCTGIVPVVYCPLFVTPEPGRSHSYTVSFGSYAKPERFARRSAPATLTVTPSFTDAGASARFAGVLRATTGSVRHPRPYRPATERDAVITAGAPVVEPDGTGAYSVRIPVTVSSRTDAYNEGALLQVSGTYEGFPRLEPPGVCLSLCEVPGGWIASGERRQFDVLLTMRPAGPGVYPVTLRTAMDANGSEAPDRTPGDNTVTVAVTIA